MFKIKIAVTSILAVCPFASLAEDFKLGEVESRVDLSFRYRIETVDQSGFAKDAEASTVRSRATINTRWSNAISTLVEFDDVSEIVWDNYNAGAGTTPSRIRYPIIADPQGTEVNQAYIRYASGDTKVAFGRQRILIANQRFVGGVGWRQNEQTFDGLTYKSKFMKDIEFNYAYIYNVNRIFGESSAGGNHQQNTHLINVDYKALGGKISGYIFAIDNNDALALSNNTLGFRYTGELNNLSYTLEFASQSDAGGNPNNYSAIYYVLEGRYKMGNGSLGVGIETLGGDSAGGQGFTTSLATLHGFQGWADVFLTTPSAGIKDVTLNGAYKINGYSLKAIYHDFSTEQGGVNLGTEIDLLATKKFTKQLSGLLKFASFNSDNSSYVSREKIWLMLTYKL